MVETSCDKIMCGMIYVPDVLCAPFPFHKSPNNMQFSFWYSCVNQQQKKFLQNLQSISEVEMRILWIIERTVWGHERKPLTEFFISLKVPFSHRKSFERDGEKIVQFFFFFVYVSGQEQNNRRISSGKFSEKSFQWKDGEREYTFDARRSFTMLLIYCLVLWGGKEKEKNIFPDYSLWFSN